MPHPGTQRQKTIDAEWIHIEKPSLIHPSDEQNFLNIYIVYILYMFTELTSWIEFIQYSAFVRPKYNTV